jgi:lipid-binding SYLF domain-containing protein
MRRSIASFFFVALTLVIPPAARASDQQELVDRARTTVEAMRGDQSFGNSIDLLHRAKAIMVAPQLVKGGFFFGAEGGSAVLIARGDEGWSYPAFYTIASGSFGLQIGLETAEVVLFVMSDKALNAWMKNKVTLGGKAGLTVLVVGSNAQASATTNANVDVIAWARSKGAYAGITLEGSGIKPRDSYNEAYYGKALKPQQIVLKRAATNPAADGLRSALAAQ